MKINYNHLPVKMHFFFFKAALGAIFLYVPVYGKQLGISPLIMGSLVAIPPIVSLIGKLIIGYAADYFLAWRKAIFMTLFVVTGMCFILMYFLPTLPGPILLDHQFENISCEMSLLPCDMNYHASAVASCNGTKDTTCHWICKNMNFSMQLSFHSAEGEAIISSNTTCLLNANETLCQRNVTTNYNCNVTCDNFEDNQCLYTSITFWGFVILTFFGEVGYYMTISVNDAICFDILGEGEQMKYGRQEMWSAIGFSLMTLLSGYTIDLWSQGKAYKTYTPAFILVLICLCIDLICYRKLKLPLRKSPNILKDVYAILKLIPIIIFLCVTFLVGVLESLIVHFLFWYIEELAMATGYMSDVKLIQGLSIFGAGFGSDAIFLFMSGNILSKFGYGYTFTLCFLSFSLMMGLISLVPTPWHIILVEVVLFGPSFGLLSATIVTYANEVSPPGTSATVQAIATGMKHSLGYMVGSILAGFLFNKVGSSMTFKIYSGLAAVAAFVYITLYTLYLKHTVVDLRNNVEWRKPDDARKQCDIDEM